jgi:hypothetical protein
MLRDIENLLMVGPSPIAGQDDCQTCGKMSTTVWVAADAVRTRSGEDFEYKAGPMRVLVCRDCADTIHQQWVVMPDA